MIKYEGVKVNLVQIQRFETQKKDFKTLHINVT